MAESELHRVAMFLGVATTPELLRRVIERCSAARMRQLEKEQHDAWLKTQGYAARRAKKNRVRTDIPFVGAAMTGGWREALPESCIRTIEASWGDLMAALGYELITLPQPPPGLIDFRDVRSPRIASK
jgi:hypothetical protein